MMRRWAPLPSFYCQSGKQMVWLGSALAQAGNFAGIPGKPREVPGQLLLCLAQGTVRLRRRLAG